MVSCFLFFRQRKQIGVSPEDTQNPIYSANGKQSRALPNFRLLLFFGKKRTRLAAIAAI
jgi:hypothetical protein